MDLLQRIGLLKRLDGQVFATTDDALQSLEPGNVGKPQV